MKDTTKAFPTFELRAKWKIPKEWQSANFQVSPVALGRRVDADYFVPDSSASDHDDRDTVFYLGWKYAANLKETEKIPSMYACAMSAFVPELEDDFLNSMKARCIHPQLVFIPSEANARKIVVNEHEKYGPDETLVLFATGLHILFKKINMVQEVNYNRFVTNSLNALGSKLGMRGQVLSRLKFPLTLEKACAVIRVFGNDTKLKTKILRYLMWASEQKGNLSVVANHMLEVLSWSEMTAFASIKEMLHASNSPVLQDLSIQNEVSAFYYAMKKVYKCEHPHFFPYFCKGLDDMYVERHNFPILAKVAQKLKWYEVRTSSSQQFFAKPKATSPLVDRLVSLHRNNVKLI